MQRAPAADWQIVALPFQKSRKTEGSAVVPMSLESDDDQSLQVVAGVPAASTDCEPVAGLNWS